MLYYQSRRRRK